MGTHQCLPYRKGRSWSASWPRWEHLETVKRWALAVDVACFLGHFAEPREVRPSLHGWLLFLLLDGKGASSLESV